MPLPASSKQSPAKKMLLPNHAYLCSFVSRIPLQALLGSIWILASHVGANLLEEVACFVPRNLAAQTQNSHMETISIKSLLGPLALYWLPLTC